ncbi:glycosyltransferase [Pseudofrankia sp. EUN1h]|uniref:glycosyltransferase n=1 Tax=Pseudofrankia sp. EUN1h TaxID=1834515 RepID=UPI0002F21A37|nr:glycosyltransferase [Pseudofrankia sp. EUN1h]
MLTGVAIVALASWVSLVTCWGGYWRTDQRLPSRRTPAQWPAVAIVVPAREEAAVLPVTLPTLLAQDYPGPVTLVLVDDASTDGTAEVARDLAARELARRAAARDAGDPTALGGVGLTVLASTPPPPGWTGKLWALQHGVEFAGEAEFVLLTDADIAHRPGSLRALVEAAMTHRLDMVSQMARLNVTTRWERLIVPAFVYFFAMLYPFRWSNRPRSAIAAAAGGCSLVRRRLLRDAGGLAVVRGAVIDDVAIARLVKKAGGRTWLGLADRVDSVRPYPALADLWNMVARSAFTQLRHSVALLVGTAVGMLLLFAVPVVATVTGLAAGDPVLAALGAAGWLVLAGTYLPMIRYYRQPPPAALLLPVTAMLYLAMTVDSARRHLAGRGAAWKGRTYGAPAAAQAADPAGEPAADVSAAAAAAPTRATDLAADQVDALRRLLLPAQPPTRDRGAAASSQAPGAVVGQRAPGVPPQSAAGSLPDRQSPGSLPDRRSPGSLPDRRSRSGRSAGRSAMGEVRDEDPEPTAPGTGHDPR